MPLFKPEIAAFTATGLLPETGDCGAVTDVPYEVVNPYSNATALLALLGFTEPFSVALVPEIAVAALVVTVGAPGSVVKVTSGPTLVPLLFKRSARKW